MGLIAQPLDSPVEATAPTGAKGAEMVVETNSGMGAGMILGIVLAILVVVLVMLFAFGGFGNDGGTTVVPDVAPGTATGGGDSAPKTNPSPTNMRIYYVAPTAA